MARKTIRVKIPKNKPDSYLKLIKAILDKHNADPAASKISAAEAADLKTQYDIGLDLRAKSAASKKTSESQMEEANKALGLGKGQNNTTEGTALFHLLGIKNGLLKTFRNNEEKLSEYGFDVVVGMAKSPTKKTTK